MTCRFYKDMGHDDGGEYCGKYHCSTLCEGNVKRCSGNPKAIPGSVFADGWGMGDNFLSQLERDYEKTKKR